METNTILWLIFGMLYLYFGCVTVINFEENTDEVIHLKWKLMMFLFWWVYLFSLMLAPVDEKEKKENRSLNEGPHED